MKVWKPGQPWPPPVPRGKYGSKSNRLERAYLFRLRAFLIGIGGRGRIDGSETVDELFAFMRRDLKDGDRWADNFIESDGTGNFILDQAREEDLHLEEPSKYYRTNVEPVRLAPPSQYRAWWKQKEDEFKKLLDEI